MKDREAVKKRPRVQTIKSMRRVRVIVKRDE